jgi:amidohydrolase
MFFYLGVNQKGADPAKVARNHSPLFFVDEAALPMGVRVMANLAVDYLSKGPK